MRRLAVVLAVLLGSFLFLYPVSANAAEGGGLCSICTPQGVALEAELAGDTAAFDAIIAANYGAGAGAATGADVALSAASISGAASSMSLGFAVPPLLTVGGVAAWKLLVPGDISGLPSGSVAGWGPVYDAGPSWGGAAWGSTLPSLTLTRSPASNVWTYSGLDLHGATGVVVDGSCFPGGAGLPAASFADAMRLGQAPIWSTSYGFGGPVGNGYTFTCAGQPFFQFQRAGGRVVFLTTDPGPSPSPLRFVEQTVTCKRADGTTHTVTMTGTPEELTPGALVTVAGLMCPTGERATDWNSSLATSGGPATSLGTAGHPDTSGIPSVCLGSSTCQIRLQARAGSDWRTCVVGVVSECTQWWQDPTKAQDFRCQYGSGSTWLTVALKTCSVLREAYKPDPVSSPWSGDPQPGAGCGLSWSDVLSGAVVYKAVGCALSWAFVPTTNTWEAVTARGSAAWDSSAVGTYAASAAGAVTAVSSIGEGQSSSCSGLNYEFPILGAGNAPTEIRLLDACTDPMRDIAAIVKAILTVVTLVYGVWTCVRLVGVAFGWNIGQLPSWEQGEMF